MREALNVNVLVAAKDEYTRQLTFLLSPIIYSGINSLFTESQRLNKRLSVSYSNFQIVLKKVPGWTSYQLETEVSRAKESCPYLMDLVTAIFVSHVKILACVRLKGDHKKIKIKIPSIEAFLHKMYIQTCEKVYYTPKIIHDKKEYLTVMISETIEETIRKQIPIESILNEYLSGVFDDQDEPDELEADDIVSENSDDSDDSEDSDDDDDETEKNIPIVPIERPIHRDNVTQESAPDPTPDPVPTPEPSSIFTPVQPQQTVQPPSDLPENVVHQNPLDEPEDPGESSDQEEKKSKVTLFDDL
jgi:hypothetical protein